ncbi:MAG TPA: DNA polymerase III subunit alpha [Solirubrobacteraceae bacterium]|nr:DNA polymerase III subunit alpha [Solirubrobacteraceae bacterium]
MATPTPPYVELHCHSAYSFLDGVSLPDELAHSARELGHTALALTDHNSVSGSMELAQVAPDNGIRAIHGAEIDLAPISAPGARERHLTLLVRDGRGWRNLCRILTLAHAHTRDGSSRRERSEPSVELQTVLEHAEGLVCLTGCAGHSVIGEGAADEPVARHLLDAFGPEGLRVELQRPYARGDRARNRALAAFARRLGVACVATGDVHAHVRRRAELQDAFVALRNHTTLDASEPLRRGNSSHVMTTPQAMVSRFADHPEAVRETLVLAERLTFDLTHDLGYRYPGAEDASAERKLAELCAACLHERYEQQPRAVRAEAQARLTEELNVIGKLGLAGFFLLHHEMLELSREVAREVRGPDSVRALLAPGRGRGSSVSSLVCYLIGLSHIDPIASKLTLGRFLHEDLRGLPDIDLDFPRDIRAVLIPRVHERFGSERAALVAAFPTFRARGAIRELGKVLGLPPGEIERAARGAERYGPAEHDVGTAGAAMGEGAEGTGRRGDYGTEQAARAEPNDGSIRLRSERWDWLWRLVDEAYRLPRHLSQHSGGMIIATRPLIDCCPVVPAAMEGRQMVQWDKDSCSDAGFLKIDLLGLGMLSAVERCVETIVHTRNERIDLSRIPFDDEETFNAISEADTVGVFQIESRAQMQSLRRTQPRDLDDLAVQVAIIRPGPIQGGAINPYIERRRRLREDPGYEIPYEHPTLEPVLRDTLGTIIFQDQVMEVAQAIAGYTPGEAEGLRRAMSRKRSQELLQSHRERFVAGAMRHSGADVQTAERVWRMVEGFAGFGFPKAHSAAFGLLAYQSTWLRVHYGPEFLCALLNEQPMGFYAPDSLVHEAERRGIPILRLDVNTSQVECSVQGGGAVRLGLGYIKGAGGDEMRELVSERERGGPFASLGELAGRIGARRGTLEQLAWSGACDELIAMAVPVEHERTTAGGRSAHGKVGEQDRRTALWQLGLAAGGQGAGTDTQLALPLELPEAPRLRRLGRWQRLIADYATSGVTVGDHAMAILRERLTAPMLATSAQLARLPNGSAVSIAGLVIARQRPGSAKGTMFLLFEDEFGVVNLIVPRAVYERHRHLARAEPLLLARGRVERTEGTVNLLVRELAELERYVSGGVAGEEREAALARVHRLPTAEQVAAAEREAAEIGSSMRAVAPPVQSFAMGRRR